MLFCTFLFTILSIHLRCFAADFENVSVNKVWHITFNMELNKSTINSNNIKIVDENQKSVPISISFGGDKRSITVAPLNSYIPGKTYSLIISKNVKAMSGKNLMSPKTMKFSTEGKSNSKFKVCIDAGYGGSDTGQIGKSGGKESSVNLAVALKTGKILQEKGVQVVYTRTTDIRMDSSTRFRIADQNSANCFISIHCNASKSNSAASGTETYYLDGNSRGMEVASAVQSQLAKSTGLTNRGTKPGQYAEVKSTDAPGIKIYLGFMSNPAEEKLLCSEDFQNKSAAAIANGIVEGLGDSSEDIENGDVEPDDIITYAYKFLGTPYFFGGSSPATGFDCSGFVQYVYAHFGIKLYRDTYSQVKEGTPVDKDQLMPGDLIFFGTNNNPEHEGIYIGNNLFIHSPHTGDVIKITSLSDMNDYLCARRILK